MRRRIVIVGGGVAGHHCAFALRKLGFDGPLVMVSAEDTPPYDRTCLSKRYLTDDDPERRIGLEPEESYSRLQIDMLLGTTATDVSVETRTVTLSNGARLPYDRLIICTGGVARLPDTLSCEGIHVLRKLPDGRALRTVLEVCHDLAIVGGGFIGAEVAASAVKRGINVTLIESTATPMGAMLGWEVGERLVSLHRAHGVRVMTSASVRGIGRPRAGRYVLSLGTGEIVTADAVLVGVGMAPETVWLDGTPLQGRGGVQTDALCRTCVPHVLAAGDCARWFNPRYGCYMRVEHWDTAGRHGKAAAAGALGIEQPFSPVPFFWTDQYGIKFQWVGHAAGWDRVDLKDDEDSPHRFVAHYRRRGRLVAVFAAANPPVIARARRELQRETAPAAAGGARGAAQSSEDPEEVAT
jgi:NADPH-dependent 2,4-dienoyl-CoA reductase/sulfur reductase-like enzyme